MDSFYVIKELHFSFLKKVLGQKYILTPRGMIPRGVSFFEPKNRITQRKLNQNRKYFNPLLSGPGRFEL